MKISASILIPVTLLALISCSEPKKRNVVDVQPGAPLFPTAPPQGQGGATANVNPPHGQPGHNCAIPVGAPLTSATASPVPGGNATQPALTPAPAQVAPGTNPPHGQPGHSCAIPVGAPLTQK